MNNPAKVGDIYKDMIAIKEGGCHNCEFKNKHCLTWANKPLCSPNNIIWVKPTWWQMFYRGFIEAFRFYK